MPHCQYLQMTTAFICQLHSLLGATVLLILHGLVAKLSSKVSLVTLEATTGGSSLPGGAATLASRSAWRL